VHIPINKIWCSLFPGIVEPDTQAVTTDDSVIEDGKNCELVAELDRLKLNGRFNNKMKICTDNKEQQVMEIGISGIVQE
jgi:hypothetical protein